MTCYDQQTIKSNLPSYGSNPAEPHAPATKLKRLLGVSDTVHLQVIVLILAYNFVIVQTQYAGQEID